MPAKRLTEQKRQKIIAALDVNPNAAAVAREVGGVSGVGVWNIAQVESIDLRYSCIDQARRRRGCLPWRSHAALIIANSR